MTDAFNFMKGYVTVRISGRQPERFINLALKKKLYLWNIQRRGEEIKFRISVKGFFLLRDIARKTGVRVRIVNKKGFFLILKRAKERKIVFIAALLLLGAMFFSGSLVLKIDVTGNKTVPTSKIIEKLADLGLKKFSLRSNIDTENISNSLMIGFKEISWVGIYENGTRITVDIREKTLPPPVIPMDKPSDIVAKTDGIVIKINAENGEKLVSPGETVEKGRVLISGEVPIKDTGEIRYVHSMGNVLALTRHEREADCKLYEYEKIYTGKTKKAVTVKLFSHEPGERIVPYFNYDTEIKRRVVGFAEIKTCVFREYILKKKPVSESEAVEAAKKELADDIKSSVGENAVKEIYYEITYKDEETRRIKAVASCEEEIAEEKEIKKAWRKEQSEALQPPQ